MPIRYKAIQYNPVLKRELSDTIAICHRSAFLIDGSTANESIASIMATEPSQEYDWRGPVIAYGRVGLGTHPHSCRDLDMNDFRHITDYFLANNGEPALAPQQSLSTKIQGVRINCIGDWVLFGKPHYEAVEVSPTDPIFSEHDTPDIPDLIGLSVFTRICPPDPAWVNDVPGSSIEVILLFVMRKFHFCIFAAIRKMTLIVARESWAGWYRQEMAEHCEQSGKRASCASGQEATVTTACRGTMLLLCEISSPFRSLQRNAFINRRADGKRRSSCQYM